MRNLLLTLGHNSSAVLIEDNRVVWGYETERVTGVKSDSRFPSVVLEYANTGRPDMAYVSHWAPDGDLHSMSAKHWDPLVLDGVPIRTLRPNFSHHDAHMRAALAYAGKDFPGGARPYGVVIDGFGTYGEHFSVYDLSPSEPRLVERVHGYETSLGLWYQYATAFLGMKMHEDEYKMLGYEAHVPLGVAQYLDDDATKEADLWIERMGRSVYGSKFDPAFNLNALAEVKKRVFDHLTEVARVYGVQDVASFEGRALMAYYVQSVLEQVVLRKIAKYKPSGLVLSGGVFYNVKLNMRVVTEFEAKVCVYPLAGDQGCALGLYAADHPEFEFPDNLFWGKRELKDVGDVPGLVYVKHEADAYAHLSMKLMDGQPVNLVRGAMEFGPRALCNTSTLALPTLRNVDRINRANDRNTVMPMAPVMTRPQFVQLFEDTDRVWRSEQFMIVALEYAEHPWEDQMGVAHAYNHPKLHQTGRPQVVDADDWLMITLLNYFGPLINTSFNYHGKPIALGMESIVENHMMQYKRDPSTSTVVITND